MNTDFLKHELRQLDTETFEVEDIPELGIDMGAQGVLIEAELAVAWTSSSCSTSSCCSCSTSSCCSCSTSTTTSTSSCG